MKILVCFIVFLMPITNVSLTTAQNQVSKKRMLSEYEQNSTHNVFGLFFTILLIYLLMSNTPKWTLAFFTIPMIYLVSKSLFHSHVEHENRKLHLNGSKIRLLQRYIRRLKDTGMNLEKEKIKILSYLNDNELLQKKNLSKKQIMKVVEGYYNDQEEFANMTKSKRSRVKDQIKFIMNKIYTNRKTILSIIQSLM